ncbi:MAG TPA: hypothetical protein DEA96_12165 [Leptospiraceae bacterium]|nr:hypothetical protein [Spirochaetaceae bacterium]HBS05715.1 hypothetical protein [Leptospiraceae bacterium]|tara:strand:- start:63 stop:965 length:903 start_codon:yes stop_codon:yes gene_type:complete
MLVATKRIQSHLSDAAEMRQSPVSGSGVFATRNIKKDELVALWGGTIYREDQLESLPSELRHYLLQVDESLYIGPADLENVDDSEYFNHSCEPNLGFKGQVALVAMRDIEAGEELTFDYAMAETYDQEFYCGCGSSLCRGNIRGSDPYLPQLQKRYQGYFSSWLEKKLDVKPEDLAGSLQFEETGAWGLVTALDLHDCDGDVIRSREKIYEFTVELCERIKVKRFGEPTIVHFGEDERVAGYSLVQLIETSLVSGHFANATNRVYLDVFSCAWYNPTEIVKFAADFFGARDYNVNIYLRH